MPTHTERAFIPLRIAVLTVSDTRDTASDRSGDLLAQRIGEAGHPLAKRALVRDDIPAIEAELRAWIAEPAIDVIVSTGGTGITGRDVTPEAFHRVIERDLPGFGELFRALSYARIGTSAILSRAVGGVSEGKLLFALPGSPSAVALAWDEILRPQLDSRTEPGSLARLLPRLRENKFAHANSAVTLDPADAAIARELAAKHGEPFEAYVKRVIHQALQLERSA